MIGTALVPHVVEIDLWSTKRVRGGPEDRKRYVRWRCSCGRLGPPAALDGSHPNRSARNGGARRVAAMERAR